jgi:hypothetical protein
MIEAILYLTCITANCSEGPHLVVPIKVSERFCTVQAQQYAALGWPAYHLEKYECAHTGNWTPIPIRKRIFLETGATLRTDRMWKSDGQESTRFRIKTDDIARACRYAGADGPLDMQPIGL